MTKRSRPSLLAKRAVVLEKDEKKIATLIQRINTVKRDKDAKAKAKALEKRAEYLKKKAAVEKVDVVMKKERAQDFYKQEGMKRAREEAAANGSSRFSKRPKPK
jgi:ribosome biogenesis protein BMS1